MQVAENHDNTADSR